MRNLTFDGTAKKLLASLPAVLSGFIDLTEQIIGEVEVDLGHVLTIGRDIC